MPIAATLPIALHSVLETAGLFRAECVELEGHVEELEAELEQANAALVEQAQALRCERARLTERQRQLDEQKTANERLALRFEHQEARLAEALTELRGLGEKAALASATRDDTDAKPEQEILIAQLEQERGMLEAELELVRRRAGELVEAVAEQKREVTASRAAAAAEVQQMRVLLEQQSQLLAERSGGGAATHTGQAADAAAPTADEAPHDPVIDSVMAQFARLQKDVNQRRLRKK